MGMMTCNPAPQPGTCSSDEALGLLQAILAAEGAGGDHGDGHDHGEEGSRKLQQIAQRFRKLGGHEGGDDHGDDDGMDPAMMQALAALSSDCADCMLGGMMMGGRRLAEHEGGDDGNMLAVFEGCTGMTSVELMTAAAEAGIEIPSDGPAEGSPEPGCTLEYIAYLGSIDMGAAVAAVQNVMAIDATCGQCLMAMAGAAATATEEENSLAACACVIAYNEATGTTDPMIEAGSCAPPTTTTTTTTETTTTAAPAPDSGESGAVAMAVATVAFFSA